MTPEIPRKDLSIIKSLNSTSCEEHCNWEEMVGEAKYSCGNIHSECSTVSHVPGTEGEAENKHGFGNSRIGQNKLNNPFLDTSNATKADNKGQA